MTGVVEVASSPIKDTVMECLYGPHSLKKSQIPNINADASSSKVEPKPLVEGLTCMDVNNEFDDPFRPLVFEDEPISDVILDDILNEEGEGYLAMALPSSFNI